MGIRDFFKKLWEDNRKGYARIALEQQEDGEDLYNRHRQELTDKIRRENKLLGLHGKRYAPLKKNYDPKYGYMNWRDVPIVGYDEIERLFRHEMDEYCESEMSLELLLLKIGRTKGLASEREGRFIEQCVKLSEYALMFKTYHQLLRVCDRASRNPSQGRLYIPAFFPYVRLAIMYESKREYVAAVDICIAAIKMGLIEDNTKGKFPGRLERLVKKCAKEGIDISGKKLPVYEQEGFEAKRMAFEAQEEDRKKRDPVAHEALRRSNDAYAQYRDDIDRHYESLYDMNTIEGIAAIPVAPQNWPPQEQSSVGSPVGCIDYVLRMRAGGHSNNGRMDLAIACLRKAQQIMPMSDAGWSLDAYLRLVEYLLQDGQFEEARKEWNVIRQNKMKALAQPDFYERYDEEWFAYEKERAITRGLFWQVQAALPAIAPKSFSGYMRMKNANSPNFQKLRAAAKEIGIDI